MYSNDFFTKICEKCKCKFTVNCPIVGGDAGGRENEKYNCPTCDKDYSIYTSSYPLVNMVKPGKL